MRIATLTASLFLFLSTWAVPVHSASLKDYPGMKENEAFQIYLKGVGEGYGWANAFLGAIRREAPLFCVPNNLALNAENYITILDKHLSKNSEYVGNQQLELILLTALIETFPCS